jgi:hypothetical protein
MIYMHIFRTSRSYYHTLFQEAILSDTIVDPNSEVRTIAMLIILMEQNYNVQ